MNKTIERRQSLNPSEADHALWLANRAMAMFFTVLLLLFMVAA